MKKNITHEIPTRHISREWRILSLLLLTFTLIVAGTMIALPHNYAAHAAGARIRIVPQAGAYSPQNSIEVKGFNFAPNELVNVYWNYNAPAKGTLEVAITADATGAFDVKFKKPLAPTGTYPIAAIGQVSGFVATGTFQLLPQLLLNPQAGGPGANFAIIGNAFGSGEAVKIYWNYTGPGTGTLLTTVTGNSTGSFKTTAIVPSGKVHGLIPVVGVGQTSNATGSYNFLLYPFMLALAPLNGSAHTTLTLSAYGFKGSETVNIFWNNAVTPILSTTATTFGYINPTTIAVPAGTAPGNYTVKAVGKTSHSIAKNTFTVVAPGASLSLSTGPVGASVKITGQGFAPNETVNVLWNYTGPGTGIPVTHALAGISGTISGSFNIPAATNGTYTVAAIGATSNAVTQNAFTLGNGLAVNPTIISPGGSVMSTGTGFQSNESVAFYLDNTSGTSLVTAIADAAGNVNQKISILAMTTPGIHNIIGIGQTSGTSFTTQIHLDTSWGQFGFDYAHHRQNYGEHGVSQLNAANLKLKWIATAGTTNTDLENSPVYANGVVYIVTPTGILTAFNATTGAIKWQYAPQIGFPVYSSPLVDSATNTVFFGTVSNFSPGAPSPFYALDSQTGTLKWSMILPWDEYGFPTLTLQTLYFGTSREGGPGTIEAIDVISGHVLWQQITNGGIWGSIAVDTGKSMIFTGVGNPATMISAYNATTGSLVWQYAVPNSGPDDDPGSGITVSNGLVYADSKNGNMYALNESAGTLSWTTSIGTPSNGDVSTQAVAVNGILYVGSIDANVYAISASTGSILWKTATNSGIDSSPAIANGVVYVGSFDHKIYAINASTGAILWSYTTGNLVFSSPIIVNGWLYCGSTDGKFYAFSL